MTMLTAAEVGVQLGISARTVYDLHASGAIPGYRFGRAVRFEQPDVDAYRKSCRSAGTSATNAGALNSTASSRVVVAELQSCFQRAGVKPKLTPSTVRRVRASMPLELAYSEKTP